jgi:hypothetical protein
MTEEENNEDPTKELTKDLTDSEKLDWLIQAARMMDGRLQTVETFVADRARDTNPMLERIYKEVADLNVSVGRIERDIQLLREDIHNKRHERVILGKRVTALENRPH